MLEIVNNLKENNTVVFGDLVIGDAYFDNEGSVCIKTADTSYLDSNGGDCIYYHNGGWHNGFEHNGTEVKPINAKLVLED